MIILFILIFIIIFVYEIKYGQIHGFRMALIASLSAISVFFMQSVISATELLLIVAFFYILLSNNKFKTLKINFQLMSYFFSSLLIAFLLLPLIDLTHNYYYIGVSIILILHIDILFKITERLIKRYSHYLDLIYTTYMFISMTLVFEGRPHIAFTDVRVVIMSSINIFVYLYIIIQLIDYTAFLNRNEEIERLKLDVASELDHLIEKQNQTIQVLIQTGQAQVLLEYIDERSIPIYSNDPDINFIMYYCIKKGQGYLNKSLLKVQSMDLIIYYLLSLMEESNTSYTITSSPLENNLIIIEVSHMNSLDVYLTKFKSKAMPNWQLRALKYLFEQAYIQVSFLLSDKKQIYIRW